jgi:lactate permease
MVDPFSVLLAASPLFVILMLIAGLRLSLFRTGVAAWLWTATVALLAFGAGPGVVAVSQAKALILAMDVLPIVWGALLFFVVCGDAGVIQAVGDGLTRAVPWKGLRALTLAWAFASFLQGAGGFGVPVVITAPLLLTAGFTPLQALSLPFIGHAWAVTFGSLGTSFQALMSASGRSAETLAGPSALLLGILCLLSGLMVGLPASEKGEFRRLLPVILVVGSIMAGVQYLLAVSGFWQIGSLGGGLAGLLVIFVAARIIHGRNPVPAYRPDRKFILGLSAYVVLMVVILCAQWIIPLRSALQSIVWKPELPEVVTSLGFTSPVGEAARIVPFGHPGALLAYSAIGVFILFRSLGWYPSKPVGRILRATVQRAVPVSIGILLMVGVSTMLSYSGMTARLGEGLTASVGGAFPAIAPWLGAVGAFLTGSNTNSNLMFTPLQQTMARALGVREDILLAGQTGGGAVGSVLSPAKVGMGSMAFASGLKEGDVIRKLLLPIGILLLAASVFTILLV